MNSPIQQRAEVIENCQLARETWRIRLRSTIAERIAPGQFVMLRLAAGNDPLLGRPFALYDVAPDNSIDIVYLVVGKLTGRLTELRAGDSLEVWGPLGHGFPDPGGHRKVTMVAGGIGQTPFLAYARHLLGEHGYAGMTPERRADQVELFYGVRSADLAAGVEDFSQSGVKVHLASDDGSLGERGFVTDLLMKQGRRKFLVGCGPEPMMQALAKIASDWKTPCYLSLETPMACGLGICFSCVTKITTPDSWDYKRVCVDGPVFAADVVEFG